MITVDELGYFLQQSLADYEPEAQQAIDMASAVVENYCKRSFAFVEDDEITMRWRPRIVLPSPPTISIASVHVDGNTSAYEIDESGYLWPSTTGSEIVIIYTHGFATIPEAVRLVVARAASRIFKNPLGRVNFTADNLNYSGAADVSPRVLTGDEMAALRRYRLHFAN